MTASTYQRSSTTVGVGRNRKLRPTAPQVTKQSWFCTMYRGGVMVARESTTVARRCTLIDPDAKPRLRWVRRSSRARPSGGSPGSPAGPVVHALRAGHQHQGPFGRVTSPPCTLSAGAFAARLLAAAL